MCLVGGVDVLAAAISSTVGRHIGRLNVEDCNFSLFGKQSMYQLV